MKAREIRSRFLDFFRKRDHAIIESASLIPDTLAGETDATLFNTAGMQPLIPYLMGKEHPKGKRLASAQKCVRTVDIDEVGDNTHATFFEMLGNWSLGDYFKDESIHWSWEFLTSEEEGLGLDPERIYVTIFAGGEVDGVELGRDEESYCIWSEIFREHGIDPEKRIFGKVKDNWWSAGDNSPSGTTTEIFYDLSGTHTQGLTQEGFLRYEDAQELVEVWNNVFMEFVKENGKVVGELPSKNVDTGAGLERLSAVLQSVPSIFDTDLFAGLMELIRDASVSYDERSARIIADHLRTAIFMIADGVKPSPNRQGYVLRRLFRRAFRKMREMGINASLFQAFIDTVIQTYEGVYDLGLVREEIVNQFSKEWKRFQGMAQRGEQVFLKMDREGKTLDGKTLAYLEQTEGIHPDLSFELAAQFGIPVAENVQEEYEAEKRAHQEKSKTAGKGLFKGGLAGDTPKIRALHTATHLMLAGLRKELGDHVTQRGSNITEDRTRFDFTHPEKVSREVLDRVEQYVNDAIATDAEVIVEEMPKEKARRSGVVGAFWEKYPDVVKVWTIRDREGNVYSRELCGGPHVKKLSEIAQFGKFKIKKEQSSSAGVRRVKAVLE